MDMRSGALGTAHHARQSSARSLMGTEMGAKSIEAKEGEDTSQSWAWSEGGDDGVDGRRVIRGRRK